MADCQLSVSMTELRFFYSKEGLIGSNQKLRQLCSQGATRRGTKHAHTHDFGRFSGLSFMRNVRKATCLKGNSRWKYLFGHPTSPWSNKRIADISLHHGKTHGWQLRTKIIPQKLDSKVGFKQEKLIKLNFSFK